MLRNVMGRKLFTLAEMNHLRIEAMQLFEECLTKGELSAMIEFIERQILQEPPRLQLLREVANDLQHRLLSLREYHFDVRERVVSVLKDSYDVDITPLAPPAKLDRYHHLVTDEVLAYVQQKNQTLTENDLFLLRKTVDASLQMAAQLHNDIQLTEQLYNLVLDWTEAMSVTVARQFWNGQKLTSPDGPEGNISH